MKSGLKSHHTQEIHTYQTPSTYQKSQSQSGPNKSQKILFLVSGCFQTFASKQLDIVMLCPATSKGVSTLYHYLISFIDSLSCLEN